MVEAIRCFEQAIARDPEFTRAYAGLAQAYLNLPMYTSTAPGEAWPKAKAAAYAALARDGSLADAHTSLAYGTMLYEWDWAAAESSFRRAIAADDSYPTAHHWYADFLAGRGRLDESLREMRHAHELDRLSGVIGAELGWVLHLVRRSDEAIARLRELIRIDPNFSHLHFILGLVHIARGAYAAAVAALTKALELGGFYAFAHAALCYGYASLGDSATASRLFDELESRAAAGFVPSFAIAIAHTGLGRFDAALDALHRGVDERDVLLAENLFDPLKGEARYHDLLVRMGIVAA